MPLFEKLFDLGDDIKQKVGSAIISTVSKGVATLDTFIDENIPGGEQFTDNYAQGVQNIGKGIQDNLDYADQKADDGFTNVGQIPYWAVGHFNRSTEQYRSNAKNLATAAGIDERAGDLLTDVATDIAFTGAGAVVKGASNLNLPTPPQAQLVTAGGVAGYRPPLNLPQKGGDVFNLTIKDPKLIADGVKKGSASSPQWITQTRDFDMRRAALREKVQSATSKSGKKNAISEMYDGVSTGPTRDLKGNPHVYQDEAFKELSIVEKKIDGSAKWKEQHHLFSKQESFQFVERMVELGDDDDVLNMFLYAEDLDATMGGRLKNMLNMERKPHNLLHTSRKRKIDGRELQSDEMRNLVQSAKTSTELMQLFNKYVTGNVTDSIAEAKAFNEIGNRMIKAKQYGWINELYDKNILRKPVYRPY